MANKMTLIIPPLCEPTVPLLGPYQMAGFARNVNFQFQVLDWNIKFVKHIINNASKSPSLFWINSGFKCYETIVCAKFLEKYNISSYIELLNQLHNCKSIHEYWEIMDYIRACYDLYSLRFSDIRFRWDGFDTKYRWDNWDDVDSFMKEYGDSELYALIQEWSIEALKCIENEKIVGINITFESQLFFALLLCKAITNICPNVCIMIGGGFVNAFIDRPEKLGPLAEYCDFVIAGEGEALIWRLLRIKEESVFSLRKFCSPSGKRAYFGRASDFCNQKLSACVPCFTDVKLSEYLSPLRIIPLRFTYQCYWARCKFCAEKESHDCLFPEYDFNQITNFCINGKCRGDFDGIFFLDSAISPNILEKFAERILENGEEILWGSNVRCDRRFTEEDFIIKLALSGCKFLKFGLESGSQKVLNYMDKGIKVENAARFINLCRKHGILVHAYVMFAFPGENKKDRKQTMDFLLSDYSHPDNYNCSEFVLYEKAPLANKFKNIFLKYNDSRGWKVASHQFTNDAIKKDMMKMRKCYDEKFPSMNILGSTGHTISFAGKLKVEMNDENYLKEDSLIKISENVVISYVLEQHILGRWRRRDGIVYIEGEFVDILVKLGDEFKVFEALEQGFSIDDIYDMLDEGILIRKTTGKGQEVNRKGYNRVILHYGHAFASLKWYGYYDMD